MPLFSNKFSPKKIPVRKQDTTIIKKEFGNDYASRELAIDVAQLKLKLGEFEVYFEDGQWIPVSGRAGSAHKENIKLKKMVHQLEEENNLLRLKFEILLDMMAQATAESQPNDVEKLRHSRSVSSLGKYRR